MRLNTLALGTLSAAVVAASALAQVGPDQNAPAIAAPELFTEVAGVREFRGVLTVRPLQAADRQRLGLTPAQFERAMDAALNELMKLDIDRYIAETDEYLVRVPNGDTDNSLAARLLATGNFQYVEPD